MQIADQQHLHSAEALIVYAPNASHAMINGIQEISTEHTHFVNDEQIYATQHIATDGIERMPFRERIAIMEIAICWISDALRSGCTYRRE